MASQADVRAVDNAIMEAEELAPSLSWWDTLKESVMPESYGESLVREIYSNPKRSLQPDPVYDVRDLSSPNVYIRGKAAVSDAVSSLKGFGMKAGIIALVVVLLAIFVYAGAGAFVNKRL